MTETRHCPVCDAQNHAQNLYCEDCGSALPEEESQELVGFTLEPVEEEPAVFYGADQDFDGDDPALDPPPLVAVDPLEEGFDEVVEEDFEEAQGYELEAIAADEYTEVEEAQDALLDEAPEPWADPVEVDAESVEDFLQAQQQEQLQDEESEPQQEPDVEEAPIVAQRTTVRPQIEVQPLPTPGGFEIAPTLTLYKDKQPLETFYIEEAALILGRQNPASDPEAVDSDGASTGPQRIDLAEFAEAELPAHFVAIYRQNKNLTLYALSDEPTQLNDELLSLGDKRALTNGDLIILGEELALRLEAEIS